MKDSIPGFQYMIELVSEKKKKIFFLTKRLSYKTNFNMWILFINHLEAISLVQKMSEKTQFNITHKKSLEKQVLSWDII